MAAIYVCLLYLTNLPLSFMFSPKTQLGSLRTYQSNGLMDVSIRVSQSLVPYVRDITPNPMVRFRAAITPRL